MEGDVWLLPGGAVEPAEVPADAAVREAFEETGLAVELTMLVGVFGGPEFIVLYRNGHRTSYVMSVFQARVKGGRSRPDSTEVSELRIVSEDECRALAKASWVDEVLQVVFREDSVPGFRPASWSSPEPPRRRPWNCRPTTASRLSDSQKGRNWLRKLASGHRSTLWRLQS